MIRNRYPNPGRTLFAAILSWMALTPTVRAEPSPSWEKDVRAILKSKCFHCHGEGEKPEGGLDLRLVRLMAKGGDSGAAIVAGKPGESGLLDRIRSGEMPPKDKKLTPAEVATIERWIASGAKTLREEPADPDAVVITEEERAFWAFQPVKRPRLPDINSRELVRNAVDAFLLSRLESQGLTYSPGAQPLTLLRRVSFDLRGLPPTPSEVDEFVSDNSPDAYERMVDRMLASPHYGERWARHWLDVAGYADSEGYTDEDAVRGEAWKYRDYVIKALNDDKPFDEFLLEQLAGDELTPVPHKNLTTEQIEKLTATGFLRMAPDGTGSGGVDQPLARNQVVADTIQIVSSSLLGLSVACAQCHNHRYDPIPQTDYYRFRALFEPAFHPASWKPPLARRISLYTDDDRKRSAEIEAEAAKVMAEREKKQTEYIDRTFETELAKLPEEKRETIRAARQAAEKDRTPEQKQLLKDHPSVNVSAGSLYLYDVKAAKELKEMAEAAQKIRATKPVEEFLRVLTETPGQLPETKLFDRGDHLQPRQSVSPGELSVVNFSKEPIAPKDVALPTSGRRLTYAKRLVSGQHPLVARVFVNRVWMHHFGRGLVATPSDFGFLGERPTHPELLDWLAAEFQNLNSAGEKTKNDIGRPWSIKSLHRLLLTSHAYRQSSLRNSNLDTVDPDNKLLARMSIRRLEAELVRDAAMAVDGSLLKKMFGTPVPVMQDEVGQIVVGIENLNGENRPGEWVPMYGEEFRRSVYVQVRRSRPLGVLETFDTPTMSPNCELRPASTVATQSLLMMNSNFIVESAGRFAKRLQFDAPNDAASQIHLAWKLAYGESPSGALRDLQMAFLVKQTESFRSRLSTKPADPKNPPPDPELQALTIYCQALLSSNRFLYID